VPIRILFSLLVLLLPGCGLFTEPQEEQNRALDVGPGTEIVFRAEHSQYEHGDTATIILRNASNRPVGYNLCISARELRVGGTWQRFEPLRLCTAAIYSLAPRAEAILREPISAEWQPGEYRMVTTVHLLEAGSRGEVFTPPFTVRP
jgi:hypothetical protein